MVLPTSTWAPDLPAVAVGEVVSLLLEPQPARVAATATAPIPAARVGSASACCPLLTSGVPTPERGRKLVRHLFAVVRAYVNPPAGEDFGAARRRGTGRGGPPARQLVLFADQHCGQRWDTVSERRPHDTSAGCGVGRWPHLRPSGRPSARSSKLSRDVIVNAALTSWTRGMGRADHQRPRQPPRHQGPVALQPRSTASTICADGADGHRRHPADAQRGGSGRTATTRSWRWQCVSSYAHHHPAGTRRSPAPRWAVTMIPSSRPLLTRPPPRSSRCCPPTGWTATTRSTRPWSSGRRCTVCAARDDRASWTRSTRRGVSGHGAPIGDRYGSSHNGLSRRGDSDGSVDPGRRNKFALTCGKARSRTPGLVGPRSLVSSILVPARRGACCRKARQACPHGGPIRMS